MDVSKPWYLSRTIWASLVTVVLAVAGAAGISAEMTDDGELAEAIVQSIAAVAGLVAILGRFRATMRIG